MVDFYNHELDIADNFATKAMDRMRLDEIPAVPQNFEVWYVYYANVNPKLRDDINSLLLDQDKITAEIVRTCMRSTLILVKNVKLMSVRVIKLMRRYMMFLI